MKILILNTIVPFVWEGSEELAIHLQKNIALTGYEAEILRIPFQWEPSVGIPAQMLMCKNLDLINADKVIGLKFPAYLIPHPNKTLWLLQQQHQACDLLDHHQTNTPIGTISEELKKIIRAGDNEAFVATKKIFTNSKITQQRLKNYNGFNSEILLPPINNAELFQGGELGPYIFTGGRINRVKRQHLLIEALALTPKDVQLVMAGPPEDPAYTAQLQTLSKELGVSDRLKLDLRFLSRTELAHYTNNALACAYLPFDEDFVGYTAMEAANAGKALITTIDSGGILDIAKHGITGWVTEPTAKALAEAMTHAASNKKIALSRGKAAQELWHGFNITWENTVQRLLS